LHSPSTVAASLEVTWFNLAANQAGDLCSMTGTERIFASLGCMGDCMGDCIVCVDEQEISTRSLMLTQMPRNEYYDESSSYVSTHAAAQVTAPVAACFDE